MDKTRREFLAKTAMGVAGAVVAGAAVEAQVPTPASQAQTPGAAAFEEYTLDGRMSQLTMRTPDAWPNTFRQSRFLSAVDFVQADRFRRKVAVEMARLFEGIDVLLTPSLRDEPMVIFNFTGHPSLTLRAGFVEVSEVRSDWMPDPAHPLPKLAAPRRVPHGVTLVGRLFDEGTLGRVGVAWEAAFGVSAERPTGF